MRIRNEKKALEMIEGFIIQRMKESDNKNWETRLFEYIDFNDDELSFKLSDWIVKCTHPAKAAYRVRVRAG